MPLSAIVSLAEARAFCLETGSTNDADITAAIAAASDMVIDYLEYDPTNGASTEMLLGTGSTMLFPRRRPITGVNSCTLLSTGQVVTCTFDDQAVIRSDGAFAPGERISLDYTAGLTNNSPKWESLVWATKLTIQAVYYASAFDQNLTGEQMAGGVSGNFVPEGPGVLPRSARMILNSLKRVY